ncbi:hypothetical protein DTR77_19195, partial [Salmonella enterica subsp. enterica serovar Newport]|nr:hypothetical protein [Salmonella enterica]EBJ7679860.1 hypothetical protein [Salmonella enterica]ECU2607662.1 hypothetical protein [Salmonella enterica subsp. enterica serovar Newport]
WADKNIGKAKFCYRNTIFPEGRPAGCQQFTGGTFYSEVSCTLPPAETCAGQDTNFAQKVSHE